MYSFEPENLIQKSGGNISLIWDLNNKTQCMLSPTGGFIMGVE